MLWEDSGSASALDISGAVLNNITWSYSKLQCFCSCPYQFYLRYILHEKASPLFYATYGTFVHSLLAGLYSMKYTKEELLPKYIQGFFSAVIGKTPGLKTFGDYYSQGLSAMQNPWLPEAEIIGTETKILYDIGKYKFTGFIDLTLRTEEGCLIIVDHKSHNLSPRSGRKKPTLKDKELDAYFRQLYLYSEGYRQMTGFLPDRLMFNCYRSNVQISEPFNRQDFESALDWAVDTIDEIKKSDWPAIGNFYQCKHICDVSQSCEWKGL